MKTSLTKEELANDPLLDTIKALYDVLNSLGLQLYVVGALARDLAMELLNAKKSERETSDLDIAIMLEDWSQFETLKEKLRQNHFKKLAAKQKFVYKGADGLNDYEVDVVPFGDIADGQTEKIKWPPEQQPEMSVKCFQDIMRHAIDITVDGTPLKMAPLAGQFLIKLDTWIDRNERENKDAIDMAFILENYYCAVIMDAEELPDEVDVDNIGQNLYTPGAQWIAVEISRMLSTPHLQYYVDALLKELAADADSRLLQHLAIGKEDDPEGWENIRHAIAEMHRILKLELAKREENENHV